MSHKEPFYCNVTKTTSGERQRERKEEDQPNDNDRKLSAEEETVEDEEWRAALSK